LSKDWRESGREGADRKIEVHDVHNIKSNCVCLICPANSMHAKVHVALPYTGDLLMVPSMFEDQHPHWSSQGSLKKVDCIGHK
jgi:hypothetical protein